MAICAAGAVGVGWAGPLPANGGGVTGGVAPANGAVLGVSLDSGEAAGVAPAVNPAGAGVTAAASAAGLGVIGAGAGVNGEDVGVSAPAVVSAVGVNGAGVGVDAGAGVSRGFIESFLFCFVVVFPSG